MIELLPDAFQSLDASLLLYLCLPCECGVRCYNFHLYFTICQQNEPFSSGTQCPVITESQSALGRGP